MKPWGWMFTLLSTPHVWLKVLRVRGRTSLQFHRHRCEWVIGVYRIKPGETHRMAHGWFIELATGKPDEGDIVRLDDDYGRL